MDSKTIVTSIAALLIGIGVGYGFSNHTPAAGQHLMPDGTTMTDQGMSMGSAMQDMMLGLKDKTGDDFDKAFLAEMITHHEGAVEMAQAALKDAKHDEIKQMAQAIISAQTTEIAQMKAWQKSWYQQ